MRLQHGALLLLLETFSFLHTASTFRDSGLRAKANLSLLMQVRHLHLLGNPQLTLLPDTASAYKISMVHAAHASIPSIIKRTVLKSAPRNRHEADTPTPQAPGALGTDADVPMSGQSTASSNAPTQDGTFGDALLSRLLRPPPIPGVENWGIPEVPPEPCDTALEVGLYFLSQ